LIEQSSEPSSNAPQVPASKAVAGLGSSFGRGAAFLSIGAIVSRITSFVAQIVLGVVLTKEDFGVFGIALGIMTVTGCLRGGVVHTVLQTLKPGEFNDRAAPYVRLSFLASLVGAVASAIAALVVPHFRAEPLLGAVLLVLGGNSMMPFFNSALRARMQVDLRFGAIAAVDTLNSVLRMSVAIGLAYAGWGPLALAMQLLVSAIVEAGIFAFMTKLPLWRLLRTPGGTREALHTVRWTILLAIASTCVFQGDYFAASIFAPVAEVGIYYFTYGLCNQSGYLAASMLGEVVGPTIARVKDDPERRAAAALRIAHGLSILLPGLVFAIPVAFPEVEWLIWGGRWQIAKWTAFFLSAQVSVLLTTSLLYATRQGIGDFRSPAILECFRGAAVLLGAGVGAAISPTPNGIAIGALVVGGGTSVAIATWLIRDLGVATMRALWVMVGPPLAAAALALALRLGLDQVQQLFGGPDSGFTGAHGPRDWRWGIEAAVGGFGFFALYTAMARIFFKHVVHDMLSIAPGRVARLLWFLK
jgi:PST family polysaccharide transporter